MGLDNGLKGRKKRGGRPRHGIVALSSAAVLAIYSAGYARSSTAARRFDEQDAARAHAVPLARLAPIVASVVIPVALPTVARPAAPLAEPAAPVAAPTSAAVPEPGAASPLVPSSAPDLALPAAMPAPLPAAPAAPAAAPALLALLPTATVTPAPATPAVPAPVAAAVPARPAAPAYADGTYTGWGTSRHGDIQAQVEIANGKIASARIISCLTRYSCSWIEALPGQVVSRQSANVDYVSGATQSTDAFYYAIVQALGKAH